MGTTPPPTPASPLTIENIPLAQLAATTHDCRIVRPNGIEWYLKCAAPSPGIGATSTYNLSPCTSFLAKAYFDESKGPFRDVCVMFNGLDETPHNLGEHELFGFYDALGKSLANHGILAIFLPSPFHLNRTLAYAGLSEFKALRDHVGSRFVDLTRPSTGMIKSPQSLYINHYQSFRELVSLCRMVAPDSFSDGTAEELAPICSDGSLISDAAGSFLRGLIDPGARISLIGYSMGGLRVMTAFCFAWEIAVRRNEEPLFTSCVAINSGGSFSTMNVPTWVHQAQWSAMIRRLNLESFAEDLAEVFPDERSTFEAYSGFIRDVTLGNALKIRELEGSDASFTRRLLFILGGSDDIVGLSSLHRITPPGGLNIFHVAGVGHMFRHGEWGTQLGGMLDHVGNFIAASSKDAERLNSRDIVEFLCLVDRDLQILPHDAKNMYPSDDKPSAITAALERLDEIHVQDEACIAATILCPVEVPDSSLAPCSERLQAACQPLDTGKIAKAAYDFVKVGLLFELKTRIEAGRCHPGMYGQVRRSMLLGWLLARSKDLVRHWTGLTSPSQRIGETLQETGVAPQLLIDTCLNQQRSLLESVRKKMFRSFSLSCRKNGIKLPQQ